MKRFLRTICGKALLFFLCVISAVILLASAVFGFMLLTDEGISVYVRPEDEFTNEMLEESIYRSGYSCVYAAAGGELDAAGMELDFIVCDGDGQVILTSPGMNSDCSFRYEMNYIVIRDRDSGDVRGLYKTGPEGRMPDQENIVQESYTLHASVRDESPLKVQEQLIEKGMHIAYRLRYVVWAVVLGSLLLLITSCTGLICVSARRPDREELVPGPLNRVPYDVLLAAAVFSGFIAVFMVFGLTDMMDGGGVMTAGVIICSIFCMILFFGLLMSAAARIKQRNLLKNTLIVRIAVLIRRIACAAARGLKKVFLTAVHGLAKLPLIRKTVLFTVGILLFELIMLSLNLDAPGTLFTIWLIEKMILIPLVFWFFYKLKKLQKSGEKLAGGDFDWHTETRGMPYSLKKHGENLNSLADGISIAVQEKMKSERMKTELITNVSHDIKTPLTSIINYADLIANEHSENETVTGYAEVLKRQSDKLKRLIEDLVEASKAASGNLEVNPVPCDAAVFLTQAAGEYEDRLAASDLTLITETPEEEVRILADGRRMWRIFDNLMNNICKYAQPGTRVYLSLQKIGNSAVFTFRNTSREQLNMTEEELMERFTRGDSSRHTEGNGLGISIAKSMAELQNGKLRLVIDGDLFKVLLSFPIA